MNISIDGDTATGNTWVVYLMKGNSVINSSGGVGATTAKINELVYLDNGDIIKIMAAQGTGGDLPLYNYSIDSHCTWSIMRIP